MIVSILRTSAHFSAVDYNERKVSKGVAELVEVQNFGYLQGTADFNTPNIKQYLIDYSRRNENIKYPQMHVAVSCKGHDYTNEQLVELAHKWLSEMGYAESGQPLLIYAHYDTANTHIHIVTSRVAPDGHKIKHDNERIRSQAVLNRLMGIDNRRKVKDNVTAALSYRYNTIGQFRAVLESFGYETFLDGDKVNIKKDGVVLDEIHIDDVSRHFSKEDEDEVLYEAIKKRKKQLWAILMKYRDLSSDKEELSAQLKKSFGISLVFHGKADTPYGYTIVDHKNKYVFKGGDILNVKKLLDFENSKRNPEDIMKFIREQMDKNTNIDVVKLNKLLWHKYHANISKNKDVRFGREHFELDEDTTKRLKYNNRMAYVQSFHPSSVAEKDLLCHFFHITEREKIKVEPYYKRNIKEGKSYQSSIENIRRIIDSSDREEVRQQLFNDKFGIIQDGDDFYCVDMKSRHIVNMKEEGIDVSVFLPVHSASHRHYQNQQSGLHSLIKRTAGGLLMNNDTGHHSNREWEINSDGLDDYDDWRRLQR